MKKLIGQIHLKNRGAKNTNVQGISSEVFLVKLHNGWRVLVNGWNEAAFPPATHDEHEAMRRARRFIASRNGTCLKKPKVVST